MAALESLRIKRLCCLLGQFRVAAQGLGDLAKPLRPLCRPFGSHGLDHGEQSGMVRPGLEAFPDTGPETVHERR
jgi:hypothetical protein